MVEPASPGCTRPLIRCFPTGNNDPLAGEVMTIVGADVPQVAVAAWSSVPKLAVMVSVPAVAAFRLKLARPVESVKAEFRTTMDPLASAATKSTRTPTTGLPTRP